MATIQASDLNTLLNLAGGVADETLEAILDQAIDMLNLYGADLPNMTGTAGSKTVSLEGKERGAVFIVARAVYYSFYKGVDVVAVAGQSLSTADLLSNSNVLSSVREASRKLTDLEVSVG